MEVIYRRCNNGDVITPAAQTFPATFSLSQKKKLQHFPAAFSQKVKGLPLACIAS